MAKQAELNNRMRKKSSQKDKPVWNNVQRINHKNRLVPKAVLTRIGKIPVNTARTSSTNTINTSRTSSTNIVNTARHNVNRQAVPTNAANIVNTVKPFVNRVRPKTVFHKTHSPFRRPFNNTTALRTNFSKQKVNTAEDYPHRTFQNKGIVDSGCSRHMTGNKAYLAEYQDFNGGPVAFGGSKGYITGKGKIKTGKLDFEDVCFVKELQHFNLFSVSQMCDKKNKVLFTDTECLVLSPEFKLPDANQVLLRIPRQNNMYSFNLENIVPSGGLACLIAKATIDESNKWHRRLGHVNFKNLNKLVKGNLVRGLPSKIFQNDHTCVACQKGKQHKASCKAKSVSSISQPLQLLHMDLFGPTSVRSLNHKTYCLVITDDFSRFSWVFFLRTKDETSGILKDFIRQIENQLNQKVKTIRCDNGTEFKNRDFIEFCGSKGIKREYSNARTPQQNGVAERKNRTLIEAARTMLADSFLPNTFWAEAVSTACYVLNRVLVTKPQNKTPYELVTGKIPIISYIRPFGCHVTILNTIDHLGKFDGKSDEGKGPTWLFDLDYLTDSMNYQPVRSENQANKHAGPQEANQNAGLLCTANMVFLYFNSQELKSRQEQDANDAAEALRKEFAQETEDLLLQAGTAKASSTNIVNTVSTPVSTASPYGGLSFIDLTNTEYDDSEIPALEEIYANPTNEPVVNVSPIPTSRINSIHPSTLILGDPQSAVQTRSKVTKSSGAHAFKDLLIALEDKSWVDAMQEELLQFKIQKVWILVDLPYGKKAIGTKWVYRNKKDERGVVVRNKARLVAQGHRQEEGIDYDEVFALWPVIQRGTIDKTFFIKKDKNNIMLMQVYVDDIIFGSTKKSWCDEFEALMKSRFQMSSMGELTFFLGLQVKQKEDVYRLLQPIETQKPLVKDEEASNVDVHLYRSMIGSLMYLTASRPDIMFAVCACSRFQKPISDSDYVEAIFRAWYATLSTFLLKNGYRRGTIDKTLFIKKDKHDIILVQVYVDDIIFGSTKKSWCDEFEALMQSRFQMSSMGELTFFLGLQVKQKEDGIFISQDKYVAEILKKFDFVSVKTASTPIETQKPLVKDEEASDVDVHLYRSMIGSLMYLTASRPDIMFAVCACSRFQVIIKTSHLSAVKRIFRYLKGKPKLGLWYPRVSSFDLEAYSDSDYAGANLDRKSTTGGCQFLGRRLISWQCKKQTIVATSTTEAEYVAAANCCGQVLWIQNQMLDYGFNFMNTKIYIDNESTICIVKKTEGNAEFHEVIDFLARSSIHLALTVSPVVSTTFVEQFWMSAKSKIINNVRYITAKVAGKPLSISEESIRSDLLFDDADGIYSLPNQAIFDVIQLMGYEGDLTVLTFNKALFSPQWRFLFHTMNHCISSKSTSWDQIPTNIATAVIFLTSNEKYNFSKLIFDGMLRHLDAKKKFVMYPRFISIFLDKQLVNVPVPLDHFPVNALTSKVFSFMVKKGKHFLGKITPLFSSMLVQSTEDEGATSERPSDQQPTLSPPYLSEANIEPQSDPSPRPSPT
ncbi:putative ribonuclease H-like domain-containing protein, partial [Tanacetum coccineum]